MRGCVTACGGGLFDVKDLPMPLRGQRKRMGNESVISKGLSGISLAPIVFLIFFTSTPLLAIAKAGNNQIIYNYEHLRFPKNQMYQGECLS